MQMHCRPTSYTDNSSSQTEFAEAPRLLQDFVKFVTWHQAPETKGSVTLEFDGAPDRHLTSGTEYGFHIELTPKELLAAFAAMPEEVIQTAARDLLAETENCEATSWSANERQSKGFRSPPELAESAHALTQGILAYLADGSPESGTRA